MTTDAYKKYTKTPKGQEARRRAQVKWRGSVKGKLAQARKLEADAYALWTIKQELARQRQARQEAIHNRLRINASQARIKAWIEANKASPDCLWACEAGLYYPVIGKHVLRDAREIELFLKGQEND